MELTELRIVATLLSFVVFLGILAWAYSGNQRARFARDAHIPFEEDDALPSEQVRALRRQSAQGPANGGKNNE